MEESIKKTITSIGAVQQSLKTFPAMDGKVNAYCSKLFKANSEEEFCHIVFQIIEGLGFTDYQLIYLNRKDQSWDKNASLTTLFDFMQAYIDEEFHLGNLVQDHSYHAEESYFLSLYKKIIRCFPRSDSVIKTKRVLDLVEKFKFNDSFSIPLTPSNGEGKVLLTVMTKKLSNEQFYTQVQNCMAELYHIADAVNTICSIKFPILLYGQNFMGSRKEKPAILKRWSWYLTDIHKKL